MDHRHLVVRFLVCSTLVVAGLAGRTENHWPTRPQQALYDALIANANAASEGSVRVYKLNSKDQLIRQRWTKNSDEAGCHDLWGKKEAYRFAQVGYSWCTVYAGDDCKAGTELAATWVGGKYRRADIEDGEPQIKILPGSNWYLSESANVEVGSWYCEY